MRRPQRKLNLDWSNQDQVRAYYRERSRRLRDPEASRIKVKAFVQAKRLEAMNYLGGPFCVKCGFSDRRALQFDHRNGKGRQQVISIGGNTRLPLHILALSREQALEQFQVLCANCNFIKRIENKEFSKSAGRKRIDETPAIQSIFTAASNQGAGTTGNSVGGNC